MSEGSGDLVAEGRRALAQGEVRTALTALESALVNEDSPAVRKLAGELRYVDDDLNGARAHWEVAFDLYVRADDRRSAARVAASLADLHAAGLGNAAAARGWVQRGRRVVAEEGRCPELGYIELAVVACLHTDVVAVERSGDIALSLAMEFHDAELEVRALADTGLALVSQGRLRQGFQRLDEALAALSAGQVRDMSVLGKSLCALLSACDRAGDLRRAEECSRLVGELLTRLGGRPRMLNTHCRSAYGSILFAMGRWAESEAVLVEALGPGKSVSVYHRMTTSCHLADLRILQGRLVEAEALLEDWVHEVDAVSTRARLHLASGEYELATSLAEAGLRTLNEDVLRAVPMQSVLIKVALARHDLLAAQRAADDLALLAGRTQLPALQAEALLMAGSVSAAAGRHDLAIEELQRARAALGDESRPMLRASIGQALIGALAGTGQIDVAIAEGQGALEVFSSLGAQPDADRTAALLRELGASPRRARARNAAAVTAVLTARERQVLDLVGEGLTNKQIGQRLFVTTKTVEHHVSRVLTKLGVHSRGQATALCTRAPTRAPTAP